MCEGETMCMCACVYMGEREREKMRDREGFVWGRCVGSENFYAGSESFKWWEKWNFMWEFEKDFAKIWALLQRFCKCH